MENVNTVKAKPNREKQPSLEFNQGQQEEWEGNKCYGGHYLQYNSKKS